MKKIFLAGGLMAAMLTAGCFEHRESPQRPVTAIGMAEAEALRDTVQKVDLSGLATNALPSGLVSMPQLETLILREASCGDYSLLGQLKSLRILDLAATGLTQMPAEVVSLDGLRHLYLSDNDLTNLPPAIMGMRSLQYLNLDRNRLGALPQEIAGMTELRWLRLNQNQLAVLPDTLGNLAQLQRLYLRANRLETLPSTLDKCVLIEDLALSDNRLAEFPAALTRLPKLRNLDLRGNPLAVFPSDEDLGRMESLRLLTLTGCGVAPAAQERLRAALPKCMITF